MSFDNKQDDFWDLEKLIPKKNSSVGKFSAHIAPVEHSIFGDAHENRENSKLNFENIMPSSESDSRTYIPKKSALIKRVTVRKFSDKYDFYGSFRKAALVYYDYKTDKCEFSPFYSYMPQYSQLTSAQKNYYFYWRDCVRRGKYIKSDYSYLYLYVYEILNLPDRMKPDDAIVILCRLWREYRLALPRINAYFSAWIQDFCLVYELELPISEIRDFIFDVINISPFKEFYFSDADYSTSGGVDAFLAYLSDYDWRHGKYAGGENKELYEEYMHNSMKRLLFHLSEDGIMRGTSDTAVTIRSAFPHSLCTHAVKCKLEIEYIPLSRDAKVRSLVTAGVRYTENKLRALFGIKSRLAVKDFPDKYKRTIDAYFDKLIESEKRRAARENMPAYERLYDAPSETLSFVGAAEIEETSWSTTARLIVEENSDDEILYASPVQEMQIEYESDNTYGLSENDIKTVAKIINGENELTDDTVAERINNAFYDGFGDVVLQLCGDKYTVIEDYEEEIREWLSKLMK